MSTVIVVVIVIVVLVVIGAVAYVAQAQVRRRNLRQRFGPEYDRAVDEHESTKEAEQELLARKKRHDELDIQPLDPASRERHLTEWRQVQERFVDSPETAVTDAGRLLTVVMGERGYPTDGYEQQATDLSVEHAGTIDRYRTAHDISGRAENGQASTEDLRQAMVHYRTLFNELLEIGDEENTATPDGMDRATSATSATEERAEEHAEERTDEPVDASAETAGDARTTAEPVAAERTEGAKGEAAATRTKTGRRTARRGDENGGHRR